MPKFETLSALRGLKHVYKRVMILGYFYISSPSGYLNWPGVSVLLFPPTLITGILANLHRVGRACSGLQCRCRSNCGLQTALQCAAAAEFHTNYLATYSPSTEGLSAEVEQSLIWDIYTSSLRHLMSMYGFYMFQ